MNKIIDFFKKIGEKLKEWRNALLLFLGKRLGTGDALDKTWKIVRPFSIYFFSGLIVLVIFISGFAYGNKVLFSPMSLLDSSPVLFTVKEGASMTSVAGKLKQEGLLRSSWGIKLLADFTNVSSKVQSGEYILNKTMSAQQILDILTRPTTGSTVVSVTLIEGMTVEEMADLLLEKKAIESKDDFLAAVKNAENFEYYFIPEIKKNEGLKWTLEGYLFPDTYEFYVNSSSGIAVSKLLSRFSDVYKPAYTERAESLGLSMHEVITLASIIEKEGRGEDFAKISAVFHNRLAKNMKLESDVTVQYALGIKRLVLTADELNANSPYNTYAVSGLPIGPICCPGKNAIKAALYPDEETMKNGYLYFTLTDPYTGEVAYSKTLEEHEKLKNQYRSAWSKYDAERK